MELGCRLHPCLLGWLAGCVRVLDLYLEQDPDILHIEESKRLFDTPTDKACGGSCHRRPFPLRKGRRSLTAFAQRADRWPVFEQPSEVGADVGGAIPVPIEWHELAVPLCARPQSANLSPHRRLLLLPRSARGSMSSTCTPPASVPLRTVSTACASGPRRCTAGCLDCTPRPPCRR